VRRPRVAALLATAWQRRVTLVTAGAGYGKTTAIAQVAADGPARWIRIRPADAGAESLSARIAAGLGEPPVAGPSVLAAATGSDDRMILAERRAALLCELAESHQGDLMLVIDGVEQFSRDEAASHLLRVLALEAPAQLHLVLSGRSLPELGLGAAQGRGELLEVTAPDLSFTVAETAELVLARLGSASLPLVQDCWALTEGWPAALQLLLGRLERLEVSHRGRALQPLARGGLPWKAFAGDLVAAELPAARQILSVAAVAPRVDAALLAGIALPAAPDLDSLHERGLLSEAGSPGFYRLSPVLAGAVGSGRPDAVATAASPAGTDSLRQQVARWLEDNARLEEALECQAGAERDEARSFLRRCGPALIRGGAGARLIEVLRLHGTGGEADLDAVLAEALQSVGEWDAAIDRFGRVERALGARALPAGIAWRYGLLLYLRGQSAQAAAILAAAHDAGRSSPDDASVSAWLSTTRWSQGQTEQAAELAGVALRQAIASGDSGALAAAHVSMALVAASRGERERNDQEYRLALAAASEGGDRAQLARIHANLSSRELENGDYAGAIAEAEQALETGAGHRFFSALALTNKAEAQLRLGQLADARTTLADAAAIYQALGTLYGSVLHVLYGELYRQQGDLVRARSSFERARTVAAGSEDAHTLGPALCGLARVLAAEDTRAARETAAEGLRRASSLERAAALCAAAEVELRAGDRDAASGFARQAQAEARATGDQAALAEALELQGAAGGPDARTLLGAAVRLWQDIGNVAGAARTRLSLALLTGDREQAETARHDLTRIGVAPAVAGLPEPGEETRPRSGRLAVRLDEPGRQVTIVALGRFAVLRAGQPVPLTAWQSRKARDLLKVLVARKGHPITREAAAEALWPGEAPEPLSNRLSVALSIVRKILDDGRQHPPDHFVTADSRTIGLRTDRVRVDLTEFLSLADSATDLMAKGERDAAELPLRRARQLYAGDFLEEDLYEEWAVDAREEARSRLVTVLRLLARLAADRGDDESASQFLGQLPEREPYDEDAWLARIAGQLRLRRHGEARRHYAAYARRMAELDIVPVALADAAGWRP
jgi:ATP/maltotriose-dependent transcriptional regulator MalT/DNA-binding SARP family transcriptional activator